MSNPAKIRAQVRVSAVLTLAVPVLLIWGDLNEPSAATFTFVLSGLVFLFFIFLGRWDIAGYPIRLILSAVFLIVCFHAGGWSALAIAAACFTGSWFFLSRFRSKESIELSFPLADGWFSVANGGSWSMINHHVRSRSQRYAIDIVRLNRLGFRASGLLPHSLKAYAVLAEVLYSPCNGTVTAAIGDLPDLPIGEMDRTQVAGNHVVIHCAELDVFVGMAHLAQGSILVRPGDSVSIGQALARVGNSGNTSEPHLHIHAKRGGRPDSMLDGEGVAMRFHGRWLIRNSVLRGARSEK